MTVWYELRTLTGRPLSRTHSLGDGKWRWITDNIKGDAECHYEDIDIEDADDGEFITVKGERYAVVLTDFSQTPEHKQAMDERAIDVAIQGADWKRLDAASKICAILEMLPPEEHWPTVKLVNRFVGLSHQEAAE